MSIKPCGVVSEWTPSATACRGQLCCIQTIRARQFTYGLRASVELRRRRQQWTGTSPRWTAGCSVRIGVGRGAHWGQDRFYRCIACLALRAHILGNCICTAYMRSSPFFGCGHANHLSSRCTSPWPLCSAHQRTVRRTAVRTTPCADVDAQPAGMIDAPAEDCTSRFLQAPPCCDALESQVHSCRNTLFEVVPPLFSSIICSILRRRRVGDGCATSIL